MTDEKLRNRNWLLLLYPEDPTHADAILKLDECGYQYAAIRHDKDFWTEDDPEFNPEKHEAGATKKLHVHVVLKFPMMAVFTLLCLAWMAYFRYIKKMELPPSGQVRQKRPGLIRQLFVEVPRRYVLDRFNREPGFFGEQGIHMFTGEQGSGKTISAVEMMLRLQRQYPEAKMITNFDVATQDDALEHWQQLLTYSNGHKGVIVGIDEIQNWFMSGKNQLPVEMLEVATQNRKNRRILCCTAQVFTRVNKGLREQVNMVYQPHTFLGCFTVVLKRKPKFDSEGNVIELKHKGMYCFVHTEELRAAYDTYKVIHTLAKEGFKDPPAQQITNVYVAADAKRK